MDTTTSRVEGIARALGPLPSVSYAAAHVYPAAAPAWSERPLAQRERPEFDRLRLYAHIPFCNYVCSFCFFATRARAPQDEMERYVDALLRELEWIEPGTPLSQLFVGGGTPTALPPALLDRVLSAIFARVVRDPAVVHTCESSPESITPEHVEVLQRHAIGRVSMGIQSLDEEILDTVHRRHTAQQAEDACRLVVGSGLGLNIDLMYGLPTQDQGQFLADLRRVADLGVQSLTLYSLRLNEGTPVARRLDEAELLDLQRLIDWRQFVKASAEELGYEQVRWHTFRKREGALAGHARLQTFDGSMVGNQLGVGNSARSHLGYTIYRNHKNVRAYMERMESGQSPVEQVFPLLDEDRQTQFVVRSLGDGKPLDLAAYERCFGRPLDADHGQTLRDLLDGDLVRERDDQLTLTDSGKLVHDYVAIRFYPEHARRWLLQQTVA